MSKPLTLRGANGQAFKCQDFQCMDSGPADTGKTFAMCARVHACALANQNAHGAIVRKTFKSLRETVLKTYAKIIKGYGVRVMGGTKPELYIYPNGTQVVPIGMDDPAKLLSAEYDFVYVNQAEELTEAEWEGAGHRCTGRSGAVAKPWIAGDCNPAGSNHWILKRAKAGKLTLFESRHEDNPSLYDEDGALTAQGKERMDRLFGMLSGMRLERLWYGKWCSAEGTVYEFSKEKSFKVVDGRQVQVGPHVCVRKPDEMKRWFLAMDEGFTNPAVVLLVGDDADGRRHVFKEFYKRGVLQHEVVKVAKKFISGVGRCELVAVDEAAAGLIADLNDAGVYAVGGKGRVLDGIRRLQDRLAVAGDGRTRLTVDPGCVETINEFESYVWAKSKNGAPMKDVPHKENDHAMDALRYLENVTSEATGALDPDQSFTGDAQEFLVDLAPTLLTSEEIYGTT